MMRHCVLCGEVVILDTLVMVVLVTLHEVRRLGVVCAGPAAVAVAGVRVSSLRLPSPTVPTSYRGHCRTSGTGRGKF